MSELEAEMALHIKAMKLPEPQREYRFHPTRRWRLDFAWPEKKVALEVEGGIWGKSRHTTGSGFQADATKYNEATNLGWRVFRVTSGHIKSGEAVQWVAEALKREGRFEMLCP